MEQQLRLLLPLASWSIRTHQTDLTWLLAIAVAARVRRGFEYTEWYEFLLELPVYALILYRMKMERTIHFWRELWEWLQLPHIGSLE